MTTKERSVSLYRGYLKRLELLPTGGNEEVDADVFALMRFVRDELIWRRNATKNAYMVEDDLTYALKIDEVNETDNLIKAQFAAINTEIIPKYEWNGDVNALPMPSDEAGLYYPCHFVYFINSQHLVVEFNQSGPRIEMLQKYLEEKSRLSDVSLLERAYFQQIFRPNIIQTIENMGSIAEVAVEIRSRSVSLLRDSGFDRGLNLDPDNQIESDVIYKIGMSREKGASSGAAIEKETFLQWLRRMLGRENDTELLKVRARVEDMPDDSGASLWLDLISAKYKDKMRVRINPDRSVESESCYAQLIQSYRRMLRR